jgi:hypothetical protein
MTKTAFLLTLIVTALANMPAHAQNRVFVSGLGLDTNPCTVTQPCRSFQHAHDTVAANGEIDVLDPGGYGPVNITKSISIQAHGFAGITAPAGNAISINALETDTVNLSGLLLEGAGTGSFGIGLTTAGHVTITNTSVRGFSSGLGLGPRNVSSNAYIHVSNTIVASNLTHGVILQPFNSTVPVSASFNRVEAYSNGQDGIFINGQFGQGRLKASAIECVAEGNGGVGFHTRDPATSLVFVKILRSEANNNNGGDINGETAFVEVGQTGVGSWTGGVRSYGDNYTLFASPGGIIPKE